MTVLLEVREKLKSIYREYAYTIMLVLKFLLAIMVFVSINRTMGFWESLDNIFLILILSLLCSLLSVKAIGIFAGLFIIGHSHALGMEVLGVTVVVMLLLFLFFLRFDEKDGLAVLLTPLAFSVGVPVFVPICYGLKGKTSSTVSLVSGTIVYFYVCMLRDKASVLQNTDKTDLFTGMLTNLRILVDGLLENKFMILTLAALVLTFCVVYVVRKLPLDYIWHIAIGTGVVVYLITMISGGLFLDIDIATIPVVVGSLVSMLMALVMEFFVLSVDYSRTERMEFEDDEYYYYVKAVPKLTISKSQREIKTISSEIETDKAEKTAAVPVTEKYEKKQIVSAEKAVEEPVEEKTDEPMPEETAEVSVDTTDEAAEGNFVLTKEELEAEINALKAEEEERKEHKASVNKSKKKNKKPLLQMDFLQEKGKQAQGWLKKTINSIDAKKTAETEVKAETEAEIAVGLDLDLEQKLEESLKDL